jgi:hypothetical protein
MGVHDSWEVPGQVVPWFVRFDTNTVASGIDHRVHGARPSLGEAQESPLFVQRSTVSQCVVTIRPNNYLIRCEYRRRVYICSELKLFIGPRPINKGPVRSGELVNLAVIDVQQHCPIPVFPPTDFNETAQCFGIKTSIVDMQLNTKSVAERINERGQVVLRFHDSSALPFDLPTPILCF